MQLVHIREAVPGDWPGVASVLAELGRPDARGTPAEEGHRSLFVAYLDREDVEAFVAEDDDRILGFVNVEYRERLNHESPQAWIPELIVGEHARSGGIGKELLGRAESAARARGCWGIALESATWREDAHRFYEREGWDHVAKAFSKDPPK
jgi:GNAT superfamily N-acetyltransferase